MILLKEIIEENKIYYLVFETINHIQYKIPTDAATFKRILNLQKKLTIPNICEHLNNQEAD